MLEKYVLNKVIDNHRNEIVKYGLAFVGGIAVGFIIKKLTESDVAGNLMNNIQVPVNEQKESVDITIDDEPIKRTIDIESEDIEVKSKEIVIDNKDIEIEDKE